jgi:hypothetical protein
MCAYAEAGMIQWNNENVNPSGTQSSGANTSDTTEWRKLKRQN